MTELSKIPVPQDEAKANVSDGEKQGSLIERAVSSFDLGNFTPPPVPEKLAKPRPKVAVQTRSPEPDPTVEDRSAQPENVAEPVKESAPEPIAPVQAETLPSQVIEAEPQPVEFRGTTHEIDRESLSDLGMIVPGSKVTTLLEEFRIVKRK
ncbi:MAG: hypothetical protein P8J20_04645, partial [Novosphingobium sp.]|nr:hypothetical protein [Novosphingobium sp.]